MQRGGSSERTGYLEGGTYEVLAGFVNRALGGGILNGPDLGHWSLLVITWCILIWIHDEMGNWTLIPT